MTDTQKLREGVLCIETEYGPAHDIDTAESLMREAADELDALRAQLRTVGDALTEQDERWGIYGNESQNALVEFKAWRNGQL